MNIDAAVAGSPCTAQVAAASISAIPDHQKFCTSAGQLRRLVEQAPAHARVRTS